MIRTQRVKIDLSRLTTSRLTTSIEKEDPERAKAIAEELNRFFPDDIVWLEEGPPRDPGETWTQFRKRVPKPLPDK